MATGWRRHAVPALVGAFFVASSGCQLVLDFDESAAQGDAGADAASLPAGDPQPDLYEPNDTAEVAVSLEPGRYVVSIAPEHDEDYWQFVLGEDTAVTITARFTAAADLDLELYSISDLETPVAWSRSAVEQERIVRAATENGTLGPGVYLIRVFAFNGEGTASYELSLTTD